MTRKNINKTKKKISSKDVAYAAKSSAEIKNDTGSVSSSDANMKGMQSIKSI